MKNKNLILIAFLILAVLQISASASIIYKYENTLRNGKLYKFKTAPVDPYDAFRGRYVALGLESQEVKLGKEAKNFSNGQKVYALLKENKEGFAYIDSLVVDKPHDDNYITSTIQYIQVEKNNNIAHLALPVDRYYMEEDKAPQAEAAYRRANGAGTTTKAAYVAVRIKSGFPVIEELYIDNVAIRDYLNEAGKK